MQSMQSVQSPVFFLGLACFVGAGGSSLSPGTPGGTGVCARPQGLTPHRRESTWISATGPLEASRASGGSPPKRLRPAQNSFGLERSQVDCIDCIDCVGLRWGSKASRRIPAQLAAIARDCARLDQTSTILKRPPKKRARHAEAAIRPNPAHAELVGVRQVVERKLHRHLREVLLESLKRVLLPVLHGVLGSAC